MLLLHLILVVGLGLGLDYLVSSLLVIMHTHLYYFPLSLSRLRSKVAPSYFKSRPSLQTPGPMF